ncbi:MAG: hypothetical protein KC592_20335, partial [Nitrospira sp.]|nr:hypothetical protein [Nitrospira sp.]
MDDLIERSRGSSSPSIIIFGRGQVLLNTWCYLVDHGADVGLVEIDPFDLENAKKYIDALVAERKNAQQQNYQDARDALLEQLGAAFLSSDDTKKDAFLSFIGYPPVLDAIGTLLRNDTNYYNIKQNLSSSNSGVLEIDLLIRICDYLMQREQEDKAQPNFINNLLGKVDYETAKSLRQLLYNFEEQSARVLAISLGQPFPVQLISDQSLNEEYEKLLETWGQEHPFLEDLRIRNAVFSSVSVARCVVSGKPEYRQLAFDYIQNHKQNYHLLYIMESLASNASIDFRFFNMLIQAGAEFLGTTAQVAMEVFGDSWEDTASDKIESAQLEITVEFPEMNQEHTFKFEGKGDGDNRIEIGPYLVNTRITLPCTIELKGKPNFDVTGDCFISARKVRFDSQDLNVRKLQLMSRQDDEPSEPDFYLEVESGEGHSDKISLKGGTFQIDCEHHNLDYPLAKFAQKVERFIIEEDLQEKYFRLRRILLQFRSHKKGGLAKFRDKIEHERVMKNDLGRRVLK